jgi:hypothetical protein
MATDIGYEIRMWVSHEIDKQAFGEDFGFAVTLAAVVQPGPQGPVQVPVWTLLLTARNPVLGEGPLYHGPVPVGFTVPDEATVRGEVAKGLQQLRDLAASKLGRKPAKAPALMNGHRK